MLCKNCGTREAQDGNDYCSPCEHLWSEKEMNFREDFVARFGETNALHIEWAAESHDNKVHNNKGSDPFRWALLICIGSECISKFAKHHEITCGWPEVETWLKTHKQYLGAHDGDVDYIAAFAGVYDEFMP